MMYKYTYENQQARWRLNVLCLSTVDFWLKKKNNKNTITCNKKVLQCPPGIFRIFLLNLFLQTQNDI